METNVNAFRGMKILVILMTVLKNVIESKDKVVHLQDEESYIKIQRQPEDANLGVSVCLRIYPQSFKDNVLPLISVRLDTLTGEGPIDVNDNRFLEVWMIDNGGKMENGDNPFFFQTVHFNFKNNGDMGKSIEKYPYKW